MKLVSLFFTALFFNNLLFSQSFLSLENAISITLENNFGIKLAKNALKISEVNNNIGNSGMLPTVNGFVTNNNSIQNQKQIQAGGTERKLNGAKNFNLNIGIGIEWTIFDGFKMFIKKDQLQEIQNLGKVQLQNEIIKIVSNVYSAYYELILLQLQLNALDSAILISNERLNLAQNRYQIGKASKLEVLNAQVDLNSDSSLILNQKQNIKQAKIELNTLMVRDLQTDFKVSEDILLDVNLDLITLKQNLESQNPQLKAQILEKKITELQYKQVKANRYPVFKVNTGYNFNQSSASLGFVTQSSGRGFNYGFSASIPIFNGFSQKRNEKIAIIQIENANYLIENHKLTLENQLTTIYENYKMLLNLIHLEEKNIEIAKQNLELTLAKFKIGTITTFELRMAQQNYIDAKVRYFQVIYQTKLNEINLKEISGTLSFI